MEPMTVTYDPILDAATRWPCWRIGQDEDAERIDPRNKLILLENPGCPNEIAHTLAHLDLGHHVGMDEPFTDEQEAEADERALAQAAGVKVPETRYSRFDCEVSRQWDGVVYCWARGCGIGP